MLELAELIKDRISDVQHVKRIQEDPQRGIMSEGKESMLHRRTSQMVVQIERRENTRLKAEVVILENLQSLSLSSEETLKEVRHSKRSS
jgi:hypothetical protein